MKSYDGAVTTVEIFDNCRNNQKYSFKLPTVKTGVSEMAYIPNEVRDVLLVVCPQAFRVVA